MRLKKPKLTPSQLATLNKGYLVEQYLVKKRSTLQIGNEHNVCRQVIGRLLKLHGIAARTKSEAFRVRCGPPATKEDLRQFRYLFWLAFPELRGVWTKRWYDANRRKPKKTAAERLEHKRTRMRRNYHARKLVDPGYRIRFQLSNRIRDALNGRRKPESAMKLLGCSILDFRIYLESKWEPGMSWDNYGRYPGWQIDHIMPCAIFDLTHVEHRKRCFHFSNMQPLWAADNMSKGDKVTTGQFQLL